jgi:hypothetical protein
MRSAIWPPRKIRTAGIERTPYAAAVSGFWSISSLATSALPSNCSAIASILAERGGKLIKVSLLRYFTEPALLGDEAKAFLKRGMALAMEWAVQGRVVAHIGRTIDSTVEAINAGLQSLKSGRGTLGKVAVIVDRDLVKGS